MADAQSPTSSTSSLFSSFIALCFIVLLAVLAIAELKAPDAVPATASQTEFAAERALTHVRTMAAAPHPIGSSANNAVREYLLAQLSALGMSPQAFVATNPLLKDVGLVLNFEARGDRGPSLLFETSNNNAALIQEVAHAAPYPVGSSLFYSLYKLLPNDTDFTVFRPAATPGLNFA